MVAGWISVMVKTENIHFKQAYVTLSEQQLMWGKRGNYRIMLEENYYPGLIFLKLMLKQWFKLAQLVTRHHKE